MNILVTGGTGTVGSQVVKELAKQRVSAKVLTRDLKKARALPAGMSAVEGNLLDVSSVRRVFEGVDAVYLLNAVAQTEASEGLMALTQMRLAGVKRVVYAASSSAYGDTPTLPKREDMTPVPLSPYAVAKLTGELYMHVVYGVYGLPTVSLRYFTIFGPREESLNGSSVMKPWKSWPVALGASLGCSTGQRIRH